MALSEASGLTARRPMRGATLHVVRSMWILIAVFSIALFFLSIPSHIIRMTSELDIHTRIALLQLGYNVNTFVTFELAHAVVVMIGYALTAVALFKYKSDDWVVLFIALAMLTFGVSVNSALDVEPLLSSFIALNPGWTLPVQALYILGMGSILIVFYLFPDGRFVPRWSRILAYTWIAWMIAFMVLPGEEKFAAPPPVMVTMLANMLSIDPKIFGSIARDLRFYSFFVILAIWFGSGVFTQIYRYVRVSSPLQRHQTKWAVFGFSCAVVLYFGSYLPVPIMHAMGVPMMGIIRYQLATMPLTGFALLLVPISLSISILRSRLWDVDFLINRALVYGGITGILGVLYFASVLLFQSIFRSLAGYQDTLSIAVTTLVLATLFQPLRRRLQSVIDRRFYREKVNFRQVFTDFAREVRTIIDLAELLRVLVTRTAELLHIEWGAVYLRDPENEFVLVRSQNLPDRDLTLLKIEREALDRLRSGQVISRLHETTFPMIVPLLAPQTASAQHSETPLIGVLALGPLRSGLPYGREDQDLLVSLADQAGTAIYVAKLVQEAQAEIKRREDAEERLEAYRNSPMGRAETMAHSLLEHPEHAFPRLHALAQEASRDANAANLLGNLPKVLDNLSAGPVAGLAEGLNYLFTSQFTAELLPIGLRTLITALEYTLLHGCEACAGAGGEGSPDCEPATAQSCAETAGNDYTECYTCALAAYRVCLAAYNANSIAQITAIRDISEEAASPFELPTCQPASASVLTGLQRAIAEMPPVVEALHAYERVDTTQDKIAYLASAIHALRHVDHLARTELGCVDRPIVERIVESWLAIVTSAMSELQTSARIVCQLLTRNTWQGDVVSLVLNLHNQGRGAALEIKVSLAPAPEYTLLDEMVLIDRLPPGEEAQVQLRIRPRLHAGADHFRARFVILYTDPRGPDQVENFADVVNLLSASAEFQFIPNPYVVGTPLQTGSPLFFGREDLVQFIHTNLSASHRNNLVLIGQRRTGKTSLLKQLPARLDDNYLPVYLDGQTLGLDPGLPNFFLTLATEITFALEDRGFEMDPPELEDFQDSPLAAFERDFLARVRGLIGNRHLLIMFDEFEELEAAVQRGNLESSIFGFLRHLIQHSPDLSVIFCGTHRIEELAADYWNILFNISLYQHIAFLDREEALRLIQEPVAGFGMRYDDLALDKMWRVTAGHPYFLQLLCHSLVNRHNKTARNYVTIADVNAALDEILASGEAHFVYLWTESTPAERLVLTAMSRMVPLTGQATPIQLLDFLTERGISLERQCISEALHHLTLRDILQASREGAAAIGEAYRWKLGLLGLWAEKYKSLSRVVDEIKA